MRNLAEIRTSFVVVLRLVAALALCASCCMPSPVLSSAFAADDAAVSCEVDDVRLDDFSGEGESAVDLDGASESKKSASPKKPSSGESAAGSHAAMQDESEDASGERGSDSDAGDSQGKEGESGNAEDPGGSDPVNPVDPASDDPGGPTDPVDPGNSGQDGPKPAVTEAPVITAPLDRDLPQAVLGRAYVDEGGAPLATIKASGVPKAVFYLLPKTNDRGEVTQTAKSAFRDGYAYWSGGGLPKGLELCQSTGEISGTVQDDGGKYPRTFSFTVAATNDVSPDATRSYCIAVAKAADEPVDSRIAVPDLSGKGQTEALRALAKLKLAGKVVKQASESVEAGRVMGQDPAAGTLVDEGSPVTITVSKGPSSAGLQPERPTVVQLALYAYGVDDYGGYGNLLGDNGRTSSGGAWWVPGGIKSKGGQIRLCAAVTLSDGVSYYQADGNWPSDIALSFISSDVGVASVSKGGVVSATGDGTVVLTVEAGGLGAELSCKVVGQSDPYPVEVQITDDSGKDYGDQRVTFSEIADSNYVQLHARIVMNDGTTACSAPKAKDYVDPGAKGVYAEALSSVLWTTSNTQKAYVNEETGFFKPRDYGSFKVYASVPTSDPDAKGGKASGYLWVKVDSGDYAGSHPSNTLNVKVVYQLDESRVVEQKSFSVGDLRAIENAQCTYTYTSFNSDTGERNWVTASARGMYLTTLLDLMNVSVDDLYAMRLAANDGVNPGMLTSDFLFHERYYWPNYELNCNMIGGKLVFPMIAYESDWRESSRGATRCDEDYSGLDEAIRFRLMFGAIGTSDGTQSKSLKYINTVTLVLKGAPPAQHGSGDAGQEGSTNADPTTGNAAGSGTGDSTGAGAGADEGLGGGATASADSGAQVAGAQVGRKAANDGRSEEQSNANAQSANDADAAKEDAEQAGEAGASQGAQHATSERKEREESDSSPAWHIYQMMNAAKTSFTTDDDSSWLIPIAVAVALAIMLASFARRHVEFRFLTDRPILSIRRVAHALEPKADAPIPEPNDKENARCN